MSSSTSTTTDARHHVAINQIEEDARQIEQDGRVAGDHISDLQNKQGDSQTGGRKSRRGGRKSRRGGRKSRRGGRKSRRGGSRKSRRGGSRKSRRGGRKSRRGGRKSRRGGMALGGPLHPAPFLSPKSRRAGKHHKCHHNKTGGKRKSCPKYCRRKTVRCSSYRRPKHLGKKHRSKRR